MVFNNQDQATKVRARGKRLVSRVSYGHWKTTISVGVLTKSGIVVSMLLNQPINGDSFRAYVEQVLAPVIRPSDLVVLDNLSSHKMAMVRKTLEDNGIRTRANFIKMG